MRFFSGDEKWSLSVGLNFLALESTDYTNHNDFVDRLLAGLDAVTECAAIPRFSRIGYRYTNRIVGQADLSLLEKHFVPAVLGGHLASPENADLVHSMTESVYRVEPSFLLVRSARLGAGQPIDPTLSPVDEPELDSRPGCIRRGATGQCTSDGSIRAEPIVRNRLKSFQNCGD